MADLKWMLVLAAIAALLLFSTPFRGDFPLNDDPYYSQVVFNFLNGNFVFTISPIAATTFLHAVYGYLFYLIFGPLLNVLGPHALLRVSIMVLTIVYVLVAFKFGRLLGLREMESFLLSLLLLTNPVVFDMALTFMTDITFSLMFLLGMYFYVKGLDGKGGKNDLLFGSVFSGAAFLVRQVGLLLPLGALLALAYRKRGIPSAGDIARIILPAAAISAAGAYWFYIIMGGLSNHFLISGLQYGLRLSRIVLNLSFYLFPLAIVFPIVNGWKPRRPLIFAIVILAIVPFIIFDQSKHGWIFPFLQNSFGQNGAGMVYMAPAMTGEARQVAFAPWLLWLFLVSSLALFAYSVSNVEAKGLKRDLHILLLVAPYFLAMVATNIFFDRYLIPLLPLLFFFTVRSARGMKYGTAAIAVTIIMMGGMSWYYNYNYFSLQEANHKATDFLLGLGVPMEKIDGGIDFCQMNRFGGLIPKDAPSTGSISGWCEGDDYVTSLAPLAGYTTVRSFEYRDPFGGVLGRVFVLKEVTLGVVAG